MMMAAYFGHEKVVKLLIDDVQERQDLYDVDKTCTPCDVNKLDSSNQVRRAVSL